jgi:hypothetical protein
MRDARTCELENIHKRFWIVCEPLVCASVLPSEEIDSFRPLRHSSLSVSGKAGIPLLQMDKPIDVCAALIRPLVMIDKTHQFIWDLSAFHGILPDDGLTSDVPVTRLAWRRHLTTSRFRMLRRSRDMLSPRTAMPLSATDDKNALYSLSSANIRSNTVSYSHLPPPACSFPLRTPLFRPSSI